MELTAFNGSAPKEDDSLNAVIRRFLIDVIFDASVNSDRSLQVEMGPSEVGDECDRRIAMSLMHEPKVPGTGGDPWPSIVGTAIHKWLEDAFKRANDQLGYTRWLTEATVYVTPGLFGHVDLYDALLGLVLDFKNVGVDKMREYRKNGPSQTYKVQAHLYGKGYQNLGLPVKNVCVAFFSRGGLLLPEKTGLYVWSEPYSEEIANNALERLDAIAYVAHELDVEHHPERYALIPKKPSHSCTYCSFFKPAKVDSGITCPGYMGEGK